MSMALPSECSTGSCQGAGLWNMDAINAPALWQLLPGAVSSAGIRGAIVDSGALHTHVDLTGQTNTGLSRTYGGGPDNIGTDDDGHGGWGRASGRAGRGNEWPSHTARVTCSGVFYLLCVGAWQSWRRAPSPKLPQLRHK